jgi:hypothetical protein
VERRLESKLKPTLHTFLYFDYRENAKKAGLPFSIYGELSLGEEWGGDHSADAAHAWNKATVRAQGLD